MHFTCLKYFTYNVLLLVVLAPNYKQHYFSLAKLEKYVIH
jgi:hypothetical protein